MLCFVPYMLHGCVLVCLLLCRLFSSVFVITERKDMDLYEVPLSVSSLGFGIGPMLANFHV